VTDILAPEALTRIDAFYDATLKPKLDAIDDRRRQVRWLIIKALVVLLPPIGYLIAGDLLDYRGFRPFPRVYRRPLYGRAIRVHTALYIAKSDGVRLMNPTSSPVLSEAEAKWLTSEMKRALRQS
jgi:hypothetical protein